VIIKATDLQTQAPLNAELTLIWVSRCASRNKVPVMRSNVCVCREWKMVEHLFVCSHSFNQLLLTLPLCVHDKQTGPDEEFCRDLISANHDTARRGSTKVWF